jgi:hypothetical protein
MTLRPENFYGFPQPLGKFWISTLKETATTSFCFNPNLCFSYPAFGNTNAVEKAAFNKLKPKKKQLPVSLNVNKSLH